VAFPQKLKTWLPFHQNRVSCALHFVGAYLFVLSLFIPLGWIRFGVAGFEVSAAMVAAVALAALMMALDFVGGALMSVLLLPTLMLAERLSQLPTATGGGLALGIMVFRFAIVIGGHVVFERRTHGLSLGGPILFVSEPVYLIAAAMFGLGLRKELKAQVEAA
jgi:uncharacterized membrane protein YGL010W